MDYISRLVGAAYWLVALALLALVIYSILAGGLGGQGQSISLVIFLFGVGFVALWQKRNRYLRAAAGPDRHLFRGILYERLGKRERALRAFSLHLERFPGNVQALQKRAKVLQELGRAADALADLDAALVPYPDPDLLSRRGLLLMSVGANREALADFEQSASLRGRPQGFLCAAALIELRLLDNALVVLDTAGPEDEHRYFVVHRQWYRGEVLRLLGREAEARAAFREALAGLNTEPPVHDRDSRFHCVPDILGHLGRNDEARELIQFGMHQRKVAVSGDTRLIAALRAGVFSEARELIGGMVKGNPNVVVSVLSDPEFTSFLSNDSLRALFVRAVRERDAVLERVRSRRGALGASGPLPEARGTGGSDRAPGGKQSAGVGEEG